MNEIRTGIDQRIAALPREIRSEDMLNWHLHDSWILDLAMSTEIIALVEGLIGPDIAILTTRILSKPASTGRPVPWHQDAYYWPLEPRQAISFWLAVDEVTEENGAMRVLPGSHRAGLLEHVHIGKGANVLGEAIRPDLIEENRAVVLATKVTTKRDLDPAGVEQSLERSLRNLRTDYIDIYQLHGVLEGRYERLVHTILPVLCRLQKAGKIRYLGITENFNHDRTHGMLERALRDPYWDTIMVGFNVINQTARRAVLPVAMKQNIGVVVMFAVRVALSRPQVLKAIVKEQIETGAIDPVEIDAENPLGFLLREGFAASVTDAAYRFCRDEPGTHVILSGTGDSGHLRENISALNAEPLPERCRVMLRGLFAEVETATGQ